MPCTDQAMLEIAARAALRGAGHVEPNPMVGAVVARDGKVLAVGHHRRFGGPHAEVDVLSRCRALAVPAEGATMYVTLEPCNHHGRTPPCTDAIVAARIARVVAARLDPNPVAAGGFERLRSAGVRCDLVPASALALAPSDPFVKRVRTGLPWVIAKWAQTLDGRVAARDGDARWISCGASRRRVHTLRGRVDAVLTGIGTVRADDPLLTPRDGAPARRGAARIVVDPRLELDPSSALARSARGLPVVAVHAPGLGAPARARALAEAGVRVLEGPAVAGAPGRIDLRELLRILHGGVGGSLPPVATVLLEAGPGLLGAMLRERLVDECHVYVAPRLLGDPGAPGPGVLGNDRPLRDAEPFVLRRLARSGTDALLWLRPAPEAQGA